MRWCFLQRTVPDTKLFFTPIEEAIRTKLIPAIAGREISDIERRIFSLPVRLGGMGIQNPTETAEREFRNSCLVTENLTTLIENQEIDLRRYDAEGLKETITRLKTEKEESFIQECDEVKTLLSEKPKRALELAAEKGAGAWLTSLPLQSMGYTLNKQEFRDAICLRYGWRIPNTPIYCACKAKNSVDHTLNCKLGGYVHMRHNQIRDFEADLLKEVCKDVKVEPLLLPLGNSGTLSTNTAEKARLDVSAVGIWSPMERTFLDVRVMHPNSPSYMEKPIDQLYVQHEAEKKRTYNDRILNVEKGSFSPLVFSTSGGMGPESTRYHKRIAELFSRKKGEEYSHVMGFIRTSIRFALLRSTLVAIRGERGRSRNWVKPQIADLSLNIIPEHATYEV